MRNTTQPIGVFDSGVGGLTVLRALAAQLPHEQFIYLGDTARLPYGTKSHASIERYALQAATLLVERGIKCLVIACNTASAVALPILQQRFAPLPVIGVVEPGAQAGCRASVSGRIAVIATEGTIRNGAYQAAIGRCRADAHVAAQACPLFVALAEEGLTDGPIVEAVAHHYLDKMFNTSPNERADTLVLGCTHFPVLAETLRKIVGSHVTIVDSAATSAEVLRQVLLATNLQNTVSKISTLKLLATDSCARFAQVGSVFLGQHIDVADVELIDLGVT